MNSQIFKSYYKQFLKYLIILFFLSIIAYIFTLSTFFAGLSLGIIGSVFMSYNWFYHLRQAQDENGEKVKTGTMTRLLLVILLCLIWVRFPEIFNIFGILVGVLLTYLLIIWRALLELFKRKR